MTHTLTAALRRRLTPEERLVRLSEINKENGCIEFIGCKSNGYGRLVIGSRTDKTRKTISAHRLAWTIKYGPIPIGMEICHKCDNRKCINIAHLFLGTRQDNIDDRERKGRNNHIYRLSDKQVQDIRDSKNVITGKALAKMYGISYHTVKDIFRGKTRSNPIEGKNHG